MSIYIVLVWLYILVLVLVIVILLHFDSVLVLVIVTKVLLSIAILFYAVVYDDDDDDDEFKSGRHMAGAKRRKNFCRVPPLFLALRVQLVVLVSSAVWLVQFANFLVFCSSYSRCPRAHSFVKVGVRAPVPWMESASLSCYSFTLKAL